MKRFLFCLIFFLSYESSGNYLSANFGSYGKVEISSVTEGLRADVTLQGKPFQKYSVNLLSSCRSLSPYWIQFRYSFEVSATTDGDGLIQTSSIFYGRSMRDLEVRSQKSAALLKLDGYQWKMIKCVTLVDLPGEFLEEPKTSQP